MLNTKKGFAMVHTNTALQKESLYTLLVQIARRHDIVAMVKVENNYKIVYSARMKPEVSKELEEMDVVHLIVYGKTTKSKLTAQEKDELLIYIKQCNVQLN